MTFNQEDLKPLKKAYKEALDNGLEVFQYYGQEVVTAYAKYCIEYLEQVQDGTVQEEVVTASRMTEAVNLLKEASNDSLVIVTVPIEEKLTPVLCIKSEDKLEPLFIGINRDQIEQILKHKLP